jgi:signal recognition particle receptor subunit beta
MRELTIIYEGPSLSGKTTSLEQVAQLLGMKCRVERPQNYVQVSSLVLAHDAARVTAKAIGTNVYHLDLRDELRASADALVFVADSQPERQVHDEEVRDNITSTFAPSVMPPVVLQLNKRDLPRLIGVTTLARLFPDAPRFISIAPRGMGVWEPFAAAVTLAAERHGLVAEVRALLGQRGA